MLATLKGEASIGLVGEILSSLTIPMTFRPMAPSGNGQGPEKPVIEEVIDAEEETFTFPYPEERGEISDIVNPPVEGISGKVQGKKIESDGNFSARTSDLLSYIFVNLDRGKAIENSEPKFVSLTMQSATASYYITLLVYGGYTVNAPFSYAYNDVYEMPSSHIKKVYDGPNKPLYEAGFPMFIFPKRISYVGKEENSVDIHYSIQPSLPIYQDSIQQAISVPSFKFYTSNLLHQDSIGNFDLKLDINVNYETPSLELHSMKNKSLILNVNTEKNENEIATLPLQEYFKYLTIPTTRHGFDTTYIPEYDIKTKVSSELAKNVVTLLLNLGFDYTYLRDRFIARLNNIVTEVESQNITRGGLDYKVLRLELPSAENELVVVREYNEAIVKYEVAKDVMVLSANLGFGDLSSRDRFIAGLNIQLLESGYQPIRLETQLPDSNLPIKGHNITENENPSYHSGRDIFSVSNTCIRKELNVHTPTTASSMVFEINENNARYKQEVFSQEADLPMLKTKFSILPEELVSNQYVQTRYTQKIESIRTHQSEVGDNSAKPSSVKELVLESIKSQTRANPSYGVLQKEKADDGKVIAHKLVYIITPSDSIHNSLTREITYETDERSITLYTVDIPFEDHLLIRNVFSPKREEQAYSRGVIYDAMSLGFASGSAPSRFINREILESIKPQASYHYNHASNNITPLNSGIAGSDLEKLVGINCNNWRLHTSPTTNSLSNDYSLFWINTASRVPDLMTAQTANQAYTALPVRENLEEAVEQEMGLTLENSNSNVNADACNDNKADTQKEVYEKSEPKEEQENGTNESSDSPISYLATAAGAVGLGVLAGVGGAVGALLKRDNNEEMNPNKPNEDLYKPKEEAKKKCGGTSQCFADTMDWLEGKLKNPTLSDEEYESISQCYSEEIKNIQRAREYIKKREGGYSCNGALHHLFHHIDFTIEQEKKYKLGDYIRNGEVQEGFKLAATIIIGGELKGDHDIEAVWADDEKGGQSEKVTLKRDSAYAQLDIDLRKWGYTPIWKIMSYIDTDTGEKRSGLYLETIAELHLEAKEILGDKDEYGMQLAGIILLVNDQEPGRGALSMQDYPVKLNDKIDIVFKNDLAIYADKQIVADYSDYSEIEKSPKKRLESILV